MVREELHGDPLQTAIMFLQALPLPHTMMCVITKMGNHESNRETIKMFQDDTKNAIRQSSGGEMLPLGLI